MALKTAIIFRGIEIQDAYVRVNRVFGGKREGWGSVVWVYASEAAAETEQPLEEFNHSAQYDETNLNALELVYESLKADRYPDAVDC